MSLSKREDGLCRMSREQPKQTRGDFPFQIIYTNADNCHSFSFRTQEVDIVWRKGPWFFNGVLLAIRQVDPRLAYYDEKVDSISCWIQIHILPLLYFKESIVTAICSKVGAVQEIQF